MKIYCKWCGNEIEKKRSDQLYCNPNCRKQSNEYNWLAKIKNSRRLKS